MITNKSLVTVRVISLESSKERRANFSLFLQDLKYDWKFVDAIIGNPELINSKNYSRRQRILRQGYDLDKNEIACFLSHREVWKECANSGENILIFEDDAYILENARDINEIINCISDIKLKNQILRLGNGKFRTKFKKIKSIDQSIYEHQIVRYKKDPSCAFCYLITPSIAKKLLRKSEKFYLPVDDFIWSTWIHGITVLDVFPNLISTDSIPSTIGLRKKPHIPLRKKITREIYRSIESTYKKIYENILYLTKQ